MAKTLIVPQAHYGFCHAFLKNILRLTMIFFSFYDGSSSFFSVFDYMICSSRSVFAVGIYCVSDSLKNAC